MTAQTKQRWILFVGALVSAGALAGLASAGFAYGVQQKRWDTPFVRTLAAWLRVPAAKVGKRTVTYVEYLAHEDALRRFLAGPAARAQGLSEQPDAELRQQTLDRAIRIAAVEEFASARDFIVTPLDVDRAYDELIARAGTSTTPEEIRSFLLDQFGWEEEQFKQYVVRPAMIEDGLRQKKYRETNDPEAFTRELAARLRAPDVKRYLKF
jgi:hypothetical protein